MHEGILKQVKSTGYSILDKRYNSSFCEEVISFMDNYNEADVELCYGETERRIWDAHKKCEHISRFREESDRLLSEMYGKTIESYTILALKNIPIPTDGSLIRGRWHIDSFREQVKVFTFLTDVKEENGPFEFVSGSHTSGFKLKNVVKGNYFALTDLLGNKRKYQNLNEDFINETIAEIEPTPVICEAGTTTVIDTSSIHRARPCLEGKRYYLAAYYKHF
jgi:hypothetical protein